jgi:hypothetical protein
MPAMGQGRNAFEPLHRIPRTQKTHGQLVLKTRRKVQTNPANKKKQNRANFKIQAGGSLLFSYFNADESLACEMGSCTKKVVPLALVSK